MTKMKEDIKEMRGDVASLMSRLQAVNLQAADADTLQSVGGLSYQLLYAHPSAPSLLSSVHAVVLSRFRSAPDMSSRSRWLDVLLHVNGGDGDTLFSDVLDDAEFQCLDSLREEVERWRSSALRDDMRHPEPTEWQRLERDWQSRLDTLLHVDRSLPFSRPQDAEVDFSIQSYHARRRLVRAGKQTL